MGFAVGDRVLIKEDAFEFGGTTGTIAIPPDSIKAISGKEWIGPYCYQKERKGMVVVYWVVFDELADDGSGEGPYGGGSISEYDLIPI